VAAMGIFIRRTIAAPVATLLGVMFFLFVLLLHIPRISFHLRDGNEWTSGFVALAMCGGAWVLASASPLLERETADPFLKLGENANGSCKKRDAHKVRPEELLGHPIGHESRHETAVHKVLNPENDQGHGNENSSERLALCHNVQQSTRVRLLGGMRLWKVSDVFVFEIGIATGGGRAVARDRMKEWNARSSGLRLLCWG